MHVYSRTKLSVRDRRLPTTKCPLMMMGGQGKAGLSITRRAALSLSESGQTQALDSATPNLVPTTGQKCTYLDTYPIKMAVLARLARSIAVPVVFLHPGRTQIP
jgi:hypothetical protein